jgi:hypothetical protein
VVALAASASDREIGLGQHGVGVFAKCGVRGAQSVEVVEQDLPPLATGRRSVRPTRVGRGCPPDGSERGRDARVGRVGLRGDRSWSLSRAIKAKPTGA